MDCTELKICTFNCCSLRKNIDLVRELTSCHFDIIALQETFVVEEKIGQLDFIDENYECIGVGATYSEKVLTAGAGRPEGGMALLWKKNSHFKVNRVLLETNFMIFDIAVGSFNILLINVYMNSDVWEVITLEKYLQTLSSLESIIEDMDFDSIYFVGDFNADPISGRAWQNLSHFMVTNSLKCFDVETLPRETFTFLNYGNSVGRWLDHIVGRTHADIAIENINILHDVVGSDHRPVEFKLVVRSKCNFSEDAQPNDSKATDRHLNWNNLSSREFEKINYSVDSNLKGFRDHTVFNCSVLGCHDRDHLQQLKCLLFKLINAVSVGSREFEKSILKLNKFKVIPGWNRNVKNFHKAARECYLKWLTGGKQVNTVDHDDMLRTRQDFKNALSSCKMNEHKETCQSIVENLINKNHRQFWKEVKKQKGVKKSTNIINGKNNDGEIAEVFAEAFLAGQGDSTRAEVEFMKKFKEKWLSCRKMHVRISVPTLRRIILSLNSGVGHDGIHSIFLKNASDEFLADLVYLLNAFFIHCYLPGEVLKGTLNPYVKDVKGNITDASNYRPVMQSSCILKIFEKHILDVLSEKVFFNHRQYGFRRCVSTTDTCFILKEIMFSYSQCKKSGVATFIDLSKAFDKVNHFVLGEKLLEKDVPIDIVFILMHYLRNQQAKVNWKSASSRYARIESGVRQGGILSPFLFKFYIDDIIQNISLMREGCTLGIVKVNILVYADDIVLMSESMEEMDILYKQLRDYIEEHRLCINKRKTKCLYFGNKKYANDNQNTIEFAGDQLEIVKSYKYLGHIIEGNLSDMNDVDFRLAKFYASFNSVIRNFKHTDINTLLLLFNSYCKPVYGIALWNNRVTFSRCKFKAFEVAYSNAFKRMRGVPLYASNHITAELCNQLLFRHHIALIQAQYCSRLCNSKDFIINMNLPFLKRGYFFNHLNSIFKDVYAVDVSSHALDIVVARIGWVQKHEPRRGPCLFYAA